MKKTIVTSIIAGFVLMSFTVVGNNNNTTAKEENSKSVKNTPSIKPNGSSDTCDKRLASWD